MCRSMRRAPEPQFPRVFVSDRFALASGLLQNRSLLKKCTKNRPQKKAKQLLLGPILFAADSFCAQLPLQFLFATAPSTRAP